MTQKFNFHPQNWRLTLLTGLVLTSSFTAILCVLVIASNLRNILTLWGESQQVSVYVQDEINDLSLSNIESYLTQEKRLQNVKFISKETALEQFKDQMASYAPDLLKDVELLKYLPVSFQFSVAKSVGIVEQDTVLKSIADTLKVMPGVDEVSYGQDWVKNYGQFVGGLNSFFFIFIAFLLVSIVFVISNVVQNSIHLRRQEIEVLELVGATTRLIRRPFMMEALGLSAFSFVLGCGFVYALYTLAIQFFLRQVSFSGIASHSQFLPWTWLIAVAIIGIGVSVGAAWICVRRVNTGWAAANVLGDSP